MPRNIHTYYSVIFSRERERARGWNEYACMVRVHMVFCEETATASYVRPTDMAIACRRMINCDQTNRTRQGTVTATAEERPM